MTKTKGLEGIIAAESTISSIIDDKLTYVGYDINDLAENASFEEVIYLLWNRHLPNRTELTAFKMELRENSDIPVELYQHFKQYPITKVHPMSALRTAVSMLGLYDEEAEILNEEANKRKAVRIQAKIPALVAAFARIRKGLEPIPARKDLDFSANFLYMLSGKEPSELAARTFDLAMVLHADHELNASTFTARVCVATLSDIYSGITAAIGALKGPLHGGANEAVMVMLMEIDSMENVDTYVQRKLMNKEKIMGFGHRVYRNGDPRAKFLKKLSKELTAELGQSKWYEISERIEEIFVSEKKIPPNVDFYSASIYHVLGIEHSLFTPIFAISRTSGWSAHILEQYDNNRIIRPRAEYIGPGLRKYVTMDQR